LAANPGSLLVAMHCNNEIGNLTDIERLSKLAESHHGYFFTDAVQTVGHYFLKLSDLPIAGLSASAHKFHGPKGVGFLYLKKGTKLHHIYAGGEQEKGLRSGTENVASIAGMAKALEICFKNLEASQQSLAELKRHLRNSLVEAVPGIQFNGSELAGNSSNSILSASFPPHEENEMLQFNLDMAGIAVSAGSACASGAVKDSHVMAAIHHDKHRAVIRFSFSRYNTKEEVDTVIEQVKEILRRD
jgi:cysteine desulfurase